MAQGDLFSNINQYREQLTEVERKSKADSVIMKAKLGMQYMYDLKEAAGILHASYDEMQTLIHFYRIDATRILTTVRIPWWSLAEYLLDPADDVEKQFYAWIDSMPHRAIQLQSLKKTA